MESTVRQRIIEILEKNNSNPTKFSGEDSALQKRLSRQLKGGASVTYETLSEVLSAYPEVSAEWLMLGKGEMIKSPNHILASNQGNSNKIEYRNTGNIGIGNTVNVALSQTGVQKIINPDGTTEVALDNSSIELENCKRIIEGLKTESSHLKNCISAKNDLIASLRETIKLLKHRQ